MTKPPLQSRDLPRRFYKEVAAVPCDAGWVVELDGRVIKTPAKAGLVLPIKALADLVAEEWQAQSGHIDPASMPLTRLANVAIDRTPGARCNMADEVAKYAETDLVCHLAESPEGLRLRQEQGWRPWRDWAGRTLDIILVPTEGLIAVPQPASSLQAARQHSLSLDDFRLTGLVWACGLFGSAVLATAVEQGALHSAEAFALSRIDETWQAEQWGEDAEARMATENRRKDAEALGQLFSVLTR